VPDHAVPEPRNHRHVRYCEKVHPSSLYVC
jgi:hypothetical protein